MHGPRPPLTFAEVVRGARRPQYPPRNFTAEILYVHSGDAIGHTSFNNSISDGMTKHISMISFNNNRQAAEEFFETMWRCKGEHVVDCYFLHDSKIIFERSGTNVRDWISNKYGLWCQSGKPGKWWDYMKVKFIRLFGDIMKGLGRIFKLGYYCGSLLNDGVSIVSDRAKLLRIRKPNSGSDAEASNDIIHLRDLMIEALLKHYLVEHNINGNRNIVEQIRPYLDNPDSNKKLKNYLEAQGIPKDLLSFIHQLCSDRYIRNVDRQWLLDDSSFWNPIQKLNFIRKLWDLMHGQNKLHPEHIDAYFQEQLGNKLDKKDCRSLMDSITAKDAIVKKVHDYVKNQNASDIRNNYTISNHHSLEMTRLYRNIGEHYNNHIRYPQVKKEMHDISQIADNLLEKGVCTTLRRACEKYWWSLDRPRTNYDHDRKKQMEHLLSDNDGSKSLEGIASVS